MSCLISCAKKRIVNRRCRPDTDAVARCVKDSPVLQRLGIGWCEDELEEGMKGTEFTQAWIARLRRQQMRIHG